MPFIVDAGTTCLRVLELAANAVDATVFAQSGTRLMKIERDSLLDTLSANIEHPIVVAHPRLAARLASYRHLVDVAVEQAVKIERAQQWFAEEKPMTYGQSFEDGQPPVELFLIFDGTGDGYMGIPVAPVGGQSYPESVDALAEQGRASELGCTDDRAALELARILDAMNELDDPPKTQVYLALYEGYTAREISQLCGMPEGTVYSWISRGKKRLREVLS